MPDDVVHVVEDDAAMRDALLLLLGSVGLLPRGYQSAEEFLAQQETSQPMCLVVDIRLPGMDGLALHRHLVSIGAEPATVIITGHGDIPLAVAALKAGALDFITKPFDPALLLGNVRDALQHAAEGGGRKIAAAAVTARRNSLTPRETTILDHMVEGCPSKVIAANLGISMRTIEHHRARIMQKMGARNLSQLIKAAIGRQSEPKWTSRSSRPLPR